MNDRMSGFIDVWFEERGFGFIRIDGEKKNFYFHRSYMRSGKIRQGALVQFTLGKTSRGLCALDVEVISAAEAGLLSALDGSQ